MATKSKNTDTFKGVVSWLCLMLVLTGITISITGLLTVVLNPALTLEIGEMLTYVRRYSEIPYSILIPCVCTAALFIAALAFVFVFREDRRQVEAAIAHGFSRIWVEIKLLIIALLLFLCVFIGTSGGNWLFSAIAVSFIVLLLYFLCLDIGHNKCFFRHNIIRSLLRVLNDYKGMTNFEQRSMRRLASTLVVIFGVGCVSAIALLVLGNYYFGPLHGPFTVAVISFAAIGIVGTILWYSLALRRDLEDWNALMAQIAEMYGGNLNAVNHVSPASNLYDCAMQMNMIRVGIQKAVEEGTKADRTKVELITNVSHDIKTPLTSIISYIELLKKEPGLPPHVMDYIHTISRKADRLSHIVQDVFDISKAATGNISLDLKDLDIGKLLQQTFAEMDEILRASPLTWKVDIPEQPILIHSDGQRLYRVFQNLLRNCAQYSLEGSRAYVVLSTQNGLARVTIRNISKNEITMSSEDLTARFVRGDQNRSTEGSGLGLSIAKSFTEACGGSFTVTADGDIFTAAVEFPLIVQQDAPVPPLHKSADTP